MEQSLLKNYPLERLCDYTIRDQLLETLYKAHQCNGASSKLAGQFLIRFNSLIGLILVNGLKSEAVHALYTEIQHEFFSYQYFDDTLMDIAEMIRSQ